MAARRPPARPLVAVRAGSCVSPAKETSLRRAPWLQHPTAGEGGSSASASAKGSAAPGTTT